MERIIIYILEFLYGGGLFINALLFIPQIHRLLKDKNSKGVSLITFLGFFILQGTAVAHGAIHLDPIMAYGNLISMVMTGIVCVLIFRYRGKRAVAQMEDYLSENDIDFKDLIAQLPGHVYWKDTNLVARGCNENNWRNLGFKSLADFIGADKYHVFTKREADEMHIIDSGVLRTGKPVIIEEPCLDDPCKGTIFWSNKVPLRDKKSNIIGLVGISIDITESKKVLQNANTAKSDFINNMEHDIRTPLTGVYGCMKVFAEKEQDPERKEVFMCLEKSAKELLRYFDGIIDFSRMESSQKLLRKDRFSVAKIVHQVADMERAAALEKGVDFSVDVDSNTPIELIGDSYLLQRVLINLVSNAIKFTQKGSVQVKVKLRQKNEETRQVILEFIVEDTGMGLTEDMKFEIFEKYVKAIPSSKGFSSSLGLGLSVVSRLVEQVDGDIEVVSQLGQGTKFVVHLPFKLPLVSQQEAVFQETACVKG